MTTTLLLAATLWLLWRFIATPTGVTAQQLRAMAYGLAPIAALAATAVALLKAPWAAKQHLLLQALAGTPELPPVGVLELACTTPPAPPQAIAPPPLEAMTVKQLRALARLQGHGGQIISRGKRADLLSILSS